MPSKGWLSDRLGTAYDPLRYDYKLVTPVTLTSQLLDGYERVGDFDFEYGSKITVIRKERKRNGNP